MQKKTTTTNERTNQRTSGLTKLIDMRETRNKLKCKY